MPGIILTFDTESNKIIKDIYNNINYNENLINLDSTHISLMRIHKEFDHNDINLIDKNIQDISKNFKNLDIKFKELDILKIKMTNLYYFLYQFMM